MPKTKASNINGPTRDIPCPPPHIECRPCCRQRPEMSHQFLCEIPPTMLSNPDTPTQWVREGGTTGPSLPASEVTTAIGQLMSRHYCNHSNSDRHRQRSLLFTGWEKIFHFIHHLQLAAVILKNQWTWSELMSKKNIFGERVNFAKVVQSPGH